jgi:ABC-type transporter Mla MlaB component
VDYYCSRRQPYSSPSSSSIDILSGTYSASLNGCAFSSTIVTTIVTLHLLLKFQQINARKIIVRRIKKQTNMETIQKPLELLRELDSIYKQKPDIETLESIKRQRDELIHKCKQQQDKLKQILHQMKLKNEQARAQSVRIEPESEHFKRMKILQREMEDLNSSVSTLERRCHELTRLIDEQNMKHHTLESQMIQLDKYHNDAVRWNKDLLRLYKYICPVEWDLAYTQGAKGFFKPEGTKTHEIITFDLTGRTDRQTANALWDKIAEQFL